MRYRAIIFDLDGTLTNTLEDLTISTNYALRTCGMPERNIQEVRSFVGNGVRKLLDRAVPEGTSLEDRDRCFQAFRSHYVVHCQDHTELYAGVSDLLHTLREKGYLLAIVSNKLQAGVDELYEAFFRDTIQVAIGEREGLRRKPAPDMLLLAMRELGVTTDEAIYVGDSDVDVQTARSVGLPCISVLWGFRNKAFLMESGADTFVECPSEILPLV